MRNLFSLVTEREAISTYARNKAQQKETSFI